jgi:hypothetical protein
MEIDCANAHKLMARTGEGDLRERVSMTPGLPAQPRCLTSPLTQETLTPLHDSAAADADLIFGLRSVSRAFGGRRPGIAE